LFGAILDGLVLYWTIYDHYL